MVQAITWGLWYGADYKGTGFGLLHKFDLEKFPKNIFITSLFRSRFYIQGELERLPSVNLQRYPGTTPLIYQGGPCWPNARRENPLSIENNWISLYHCQEHPFNFKFAMNGCDLYANYLDLVVGIYPPDVIPTTYGNYLHVPNWLRSGKVPFYSGYGIPTVAQVQEFIEQVESARIYKVNRPALAVAIARHDALEGVPGVRGQICDALVEVAKPLIGDNPPIFYAGAWRCNTTELQDKFNDDKVTYMRNFLFNVCPENSKTPGYVSEKIMESFLAGCTPIYWGGIETELDYINPKAIVFYDHENPQAFKTELHNLIENGFTKLYHEKLAEPAFLPGAAARIWLRYIYPVAKRFSELQGGVNLYQTLIEPIDTSLEEQFTIAQAQLAALGLKEDKYLYLVEPQHQAPFSYTDNTEELPEEDKRTLLKFLIQYGVRES